MLPDPSHPLWSTVGVALVSALGIIAVLVKAVVDGRRQRNGHGHLTHAEVREHFDLLRQQIDARMDGVRGQVDEVYESQRRLREEVNLLVGRLDNRLARLEDRESNRRAM
jgi:hypothetical protein